MLTIVHDKDVFADGYADGAASRQEEIDAMAAELKSKDIELEANRVELEAKDIKLKETEDENARLNKEVEMLRQTIASVSNKQ